jgi:hypothetical protein
MKCNLTKRKKVMFLMAAMLVSKAQARIEEKESTSSEMSNASNDQEEIVKTITVTQEVVTENRTTHEQTKTTAEAFIAFEPNAITVEETQTIENMVVEAKTVQELADMINNNEIRTYRQFIAACKNFPELIEIAARFLQENITDSRSAIAKFGTVKSPQAKKMIIMLVTKVKDKDKLWNLFRN